MIDPNTQLLRQITHVGHAESPKWSPDGSRILFIRRPELTATSRELWVTNADGSGVRRLSSAQDVVAADWSPEGSRIALVRTSSKTHTIQLWIVDVDGSNARTLSQPVKGVEATLDW